MTIRNLTPHAINIIGEHGTTTFASEGIARLAVTTEEVASIGNIPVTRSVFGTPEGLPEEDPGTVLIVSRLIVAALPDRADLFHPNEMIRDDAGRIIGCRSISR